MTDLTIRQLNGWDITISKGNKDRIINSIVTYSRKKPQKWTTGGVPAVNKSWIKSGTKGSERLYNKPT